MFSIEFYYDMHAVSISQEDRSVTLTLADNNTVNRSIHEKVNTEIVYKATGYTSFYAAVKELYLSTDLSVDNAMKQQIIAFDDFCNLPR